VNDAAPSARAIPFAPAVAAAILLAGTGGAVLTRAATPVPVVVAFERAPFPYIVIRVPVAGQGCQAMLFDTGTNTTVLDPPLAARGGLVTGRETTVESLSGTSRAIAGEVRGIGFDGIPARSPRIAVATSVTGVRTISRSIRGIYGHDWLAGTDYVIDYGRKRIAIGLAGAVPRPAGGQRATLTWVSGRPAITVTIRARNVEPFTARLVVDSGADSMALFGRAAKALAPAADAAQTVTFDSGFGVREVLATQITVTIDGREHSLIAQVRSDLTDREEDGLLPPSVFRSVFVGTGDRVVVFDGQWLAENWGQNGANCGFK